MGICFGDKTEAKLRRLNESHSLEVQQNQEKLKEDYQGDSVKNEKNEDGDIDS